MGYEVRDVVGYEGWYVVSNKGEVFSRCKGNMGPGDRMIPKSARIDPNGYPTVNLYKKGSGKTFKVHTIVMLAFVGPRPQGMQIRHLDGNPSNNKSSNLAYGTCRENQLDRRRHGTSHVGERAVQSILTEDIVSDLRYLYAHGLSPTRLAKVFGIKFTTVWTVVTNASWKHVPVPESPDYIHAKVAIEIQ